MAKSVRKQQGKRNSPNNETAKLHDPHFDYVGEAFLRHTSEMDHDKLSNWRPKSFSFTRLNSWYSSLIGVHRKRTGVGKDKLVWLETGKETNPCLLLMHGFAAAKEHWLPLLPFLAGQFRILIPDLPGWGESGFNAERRYGLEEQADRMHQWLLSIGVNKVNLVGNSMGGAVAGFLSARFPETINSLVLMDALGVNGTQQTEFIQELMQGKNRLVPCDAIEVMKLTNLVFHNRILATSAAFFSASELIHRRDVNAFLFHEMLNHRPHHIASTLGSITAPTLVIWGKQDDVLDVSCAFEFERLIKGSRTQILDGVGHLPMIEAPHICARTIKEFIQSNV